MNLYSIPFALTKNDIKIHRLGGEALKRLNFEGILVKASEGVYKYIE